MRKFEWWYVYRIINITKKEVYHGVSKDVNTRIKEGHCKGRTKAVKYWKCEGDRIEWEIISKHKTQRTASQAAHKQEKYFKKRGYKNIQTAGI